MMDQIDFTEWPRNAFGRLLCTHTQPMPAHRPKTVMERWAHQGAELVDDIANVQRWRCADCGLTWEKTT